MQTRMLFSEEQIRQRVEELAAQINLHYQNRTVDVLCVLKSSLFFAADLIRRLQFPLRIHFLQARSYVEGSETSGTVRLHYSSDWAWDGCDILLLEDILDTGITLQYIQEHLRERKPKDLKTCVLLNKPARRKVHVEVDYIGFDIENQFVVGYGLDFNEFGRNLPHLAILEQ